ncbi:MinD/ParA family protein [Desulfonatronovibrio hydrogenovorans]|uniref:MinD/ParA family protein n=1 Tax=Desulfonatronovibrio hydrogenovorans TaxID=53245 RepID=UPI00048F5CEC|nr:MinD/ParA family protein [Desulfonatronovibrio hydrogenovorans]
MQRQNRTFSLSILSGKGGVGKTNIALNLAYALYQAGQNTLLVDCDLGLANLDVMLGIAPEGSLHDILNHNAKVEDILFNLGKNGLDLIPAASGVTDILDLDEDQQDNVVQRLTKVMSKYNFLLLDLGAGINQTVQSFAAMTHHQVVVITPEPTSLTDGYALIKVLYTQKKAKNFHILVNMVHSEQEGRLGFERIRAACEKFLELEVDFLGFVRQDDVVPESVRMQKPFFQTAANSNPARDVLNIAHRLIRIRNDSLERIVSTPALRLEDLDGID